MNIRFKLSISNLQFFNSIGGCILTRDMFTTPNLSIVVCNLKNKSKIFGSVKKLIKEELLPMSLDWKIRK